MNTDKTVIDISNESLRDSYERYLKTADSEMRRMYGHHLRSYESGANWQREQDKQTIDKLAGMLKKYVDDDNGDRAEVGFYSKMKNSRYKTSCELLNQLQK